MLNLAFKALFLQSVINLWGRFVLSTVFALEVDAKLNDAISFTLKGKHVNYVIARYYAYYKIHWVITNCWSL